MIRRIATPLFLLMLGLTCFAVLTPLPPLAAREIPLPEEEAPAALFSADLYDAEVDFFLEGSWTASLQGGAGVTWGDGISGVQPAVPSGFTDGFKFEQIPQLTLSLWYMDRYFFETTITEEQQLETFLFGYFGEEDDFLREARFGNTDIGYGDYGLFSVPAASRHSLGGYARFEGSDSEHHLAARYDPAQLEELHFRGTRQLEETRQAPQDFIHGRFFILPDADIDFLRVYVQDDAGTVSGGGSTYRRLSDDEMVYSIAEGLLFLRSPAESELEVYYEKGGTAVGDPNLGTNALTGIDSEKLSLEATPVDFYWEGTHNDYPTEPYDPYFSFLDIQSFIDWQRTIDGSQGLLIYSPGQWSPFELRSVYAAGSTVQADSGNTTLWLADKNSSGGSRLPIEQFQDNDKARIAPSGFDLRSNEARYPLLVYTEESSWAQSIYGPGPSDGSEPVEKELRFEQLSPVGSYNLGTNVLEGSITVLRNGVPEQRFSFNSDTGEINFFIPPGQNERIDISFRSTSAQAVGGDIFAAAVNHFNFNEQWSADLNLGLRWNADPNAYITEPGEAEGSMLTAGRLAYRSDRFSFAVESGINVRSPNTTGRLRLYGMNDSAFPVSINGELMYPGAPVNATNYESASIGPFDHASRGQLFYKDYYNYSFAGGYQLQKYTWDPPADQVYPYSHSGGDNRTGPYIAATGSETEGNAMVLEYSLASGEWVGGTIPLHEGNGAVDLSHVRAITFLVKITGRDSNPPDYNIDLHLLLGRLYEDLDADGKLDEEDSPLDGGFAFNDEGFVLPVAPALPWAPSESRVNSEDLDGNGVLDGASAALPVPVVKTPSIEPETTWQRITIPLTDEDREKLKSSTGIEFVVAESGASTAEGRLLIADIDLQGTPFTGAADNATDFEVFTRALDPGSSSYESLMDQPEADLLNEDSVFNTKVTRVDWTSNDWSMTGYHTPFQLDEYDSFSFFMRTEEEEPDTLRLILRNPQDEGLAVEFTPPNAHSDWRRYTWKLHSSDPDDRILVDGSPVAGGAQLVTPDGLKTEEAATGVNEFTVEALAGGDGALEIDEVYLHDPRLDIGAGGRTEVEYHYPEALIRIGEQPLLHQLNFRQTVYGRQPGYQGGLTPAPAAAVAFTNSLDFKLLSSSIGLHYNGQWDAEEYLPAGGYRVSLPLAENRFQLSDEYSEQHNHDSIDILRAAGVSLSSRKQSSLGFNSTLLWENRVMDRTWDLSAALRERDKLQVTLESGLHSRNAEIDAEEGAFGNRYARFTELFYPVRTSGPHFRRTEHALGIAFKGNRLDADFSHSFSTATSAEQSPFALKAGGSWTARLSSRIGKNPTRSLRLKHTYSRDSLFEAEYGQQNGFIEDLSSLPGRLLDSPFIWTAVPYYELWSEELLQEFQWKTEGRLNAAYTPSSEISVDRNPGSRLYDLLAPARISFGVERTLQRDLDSVTDAHSLNGLYRATALNLFGRLGRYSVFEWYRTEEISHSLLYSGALDAEEQKHEFTLGQFVELNLNQQSRVGVHSTWKQTLGESVRSVDSRLYWRHSRQFEGAVPFEEKIRIKGEKRLEHSEEIEFSLQDESADVRSLMLTAGHTSTLILGENGSLKGFARAGYRRNESAGTITSSVQHTIAVEIGTELILSY
ncbi:MAG: hypothetical protein ACOCZA_00080 [Spirochaetota bacterium]